MINLRPEEGIGRRFRYMDDGGRTLLRFDKFSDHPGVNRHYHHTPDGVFDDTEYTGLREHIQTFYDAMADLREE